MSSKRPLFCCHNMSGVLVMSASWNLLKAWRAICHSAMTCPQEKRIGLGLEESKSKGQLCHHNPFL
eukprot:10784947-Prorocentrum_lima.AAC.1